MFKLIITSWRGARKVYYGDFDAVVSIFTKGSNHGMESGFDPWVDSLKYIPLELDDLHPLLCVPGERWDESATVKGQAKGTPDNLVPGLPTANHILQIIRLAQSLPKDSRVLLHCAAGNSRSVSAGIIMLRAQGRSDEESIAEVFRLRRRANPNGWMLKLADILLGSNLFDICEKSPYRVKWYASL